MPESDAPRLSGAGFPATGTLKPELLGRIPGHMASRLNLLPVGFKEPKTLVVAMANPFDFEALDALRVFTGLEIEPRACSLKALRAAIASHYRLPSMIAETT